MEDDFNTLTHRVDSPQNWLHSACDFPHEACDFPHEACDFPHEACDFPHEACDFPHEACDFPHEACDFPHEACDFHPKGMRLIERKTTSSGHSLTQQRQNRPILHLIERVGGGGNWWGTLVFNKS